MAWGTVPMFVKHLLWDKKDLCKIPQTGPVNMHWIHVKTLKYKAGTFSIHSLMSGQGFSHWKYVWDEVGVHHYSNNELHNMIADYFRHLMKLIHKDPGRGIFIKFRKNRDREEKEVVMFLSTHPWNSRCFLSSWFQENSETFGHWQWLQSSGHWASNCVEF